MLITSVTGTSVFRAQNSHKLVLLVQPHQLLALAHEVAATFVEALVQPDQLLPLAHEVADALAEVVAGVLQLLEEAFLVLLLLFDDDVRVVSDMTVTRRGLAVVSVARRIHSG